MFLLSVAIMIGYVTAETPTTFELVSYFILAGSILYVVLCSVCQRGFSGYLTRKRGEKWTKEIDYIYLLFAAAGATVTLSKLPNVQTHPPLLNAVGPLFLVFAIVIRLLKTRAEIEGWNKRFDDPAKSA
jgi:hypothetical protein